MDKAQISVRLPADLLETLDQVARALDRDRSWVLTRALRQYAEAEGSDVLAEQRCIDDVAAGRVHDFDSVMEEAEAIVANARRTAKRRAG